MDWDSLLAKAQSALGVAKTELLAIILLIGGLAGGLAYQCASGGDAGINQNSKEIYSLFDSLAESQRSEFRGDSSDDSKDSRQDAYAAKTNESKPEFGKKKEMPPGKIDLNKAGISELVRLPGIGEAIAARIIEYRKARKFDKISDIMLVKGIGGKKFEKLKDFIKIE